MTNTRQKTILLVEDEALIALDETSTLEDYGYAVITASCGEDAIKIVDSGNRVDLILMDINLGEGIDGTETAKRILEKHDLPLIFLSSHTEREIVNKTEGITSYGYIVKNSGETVFIQSIKMAFRLYDATLRKWEREELRLKSLVLDQITDHVTITDINGVITYVNKIQEKDLKIPKEKLIGNPTVIYGEDSSRGATQKEILTKTLEHGRWRGEVVNYAADGKEIVLDCRTQIIRDNEGNPISLCGISTDITDRKNTEERLKKSESLQSLILSAIPDMLMRFDKEGRYLDIINYRDDELAAPKEAVIGKTVSSVIPAELGIKLENTIRSVVETGKMKKVEYGLDVPAGHCYFEARIIPFTENEAISLTRDITEKRKAEKALEESEEKYRLLVEKAHDGIEISQDDMIIFCNQQFADMLGYSVKELKNISFLDIYTEEGLEQLYERQKLRLAGEPLSQSYTTTFRKKDGTVIDVDVNYEITEYRNRPATFAIIRDITEKKKTQKALWESERTYLGLIDGMVDTAWVINFDGKLIDVNKTAETLLGYTKEELFEIGLWGIDSSLSKENIIHLIKNIPKDKVQNFETVHKTKDGTMIPVEICSTIITFHGEKAILSIARNITERKKNEDQIKSLLNEKELLLKETHHRIKNNMGTIKSLLSLQAKLHNNPDVQKTLFDAAARVQSMAVLYDKLYRSHAFRELNIRDFLTSLIPEIQKLYTLDIQINTVLDIEDIMLDSKTLSALGIILNECMTNSIKHAFKTIENPEISIHVYKTASGTRLIYNDNGSGIFSLDDMKESSTFGLQLLSMMISQINGTMAIDTQKSLKFTFDF